MGDKTVFLLKTVHRNTPKQATKMRLLKCIYVSVRLILVLEIVEISRGEQELNSLFSKIKLA